MSKLKVMTALALFGMHATPAVADTELGFKAGTLGLGVEAGFAFNERWGIRGGINQFQYDFEDDIDGVDFDGDLDLSTITLLGDYRPTGGGFRVTAGAVINSNEVGALALPVADYEIGNNFYTLEEVGDLSAVAEFDSLAPYLGLGYDWDLSDRLGLSLDLGALFQGTADISINSVGGTLSNDAVLRADLDIEESLGEEDLDDLELYPVISVGLYYAFE